jgi:hypothetical protein
MRKASLEICWMRSEIAHPCCGPNAKVLRDQQVKRSLRQVNVCLRHRRYSPATSTTTIYAVSCRSTRGAGFYLPTGVLIYWLQSRRLNRELGTFKHSEMRAM